MGIGFLLTVDDDDLQITELKLSKTSGGRTDTPSQVFGTSRLRDSNCSDGSRTATTIAHERKLFGMDGLNESICMVTID